MGSHIPDQNNGAGFLLVVVITTRPPPSPEWYVPSKSLDPLLPCNISLRQNTDVEKNTSTKKGSDRIGSGGHVSRCVFRDLACTRPVSSDNDDSLLCEGIVDLGAALQSTTSTLGTHRVTRGCANHLEQPGFCMYSFCRRRYKNKIRPPTGTRCIFTNKTAVLGTHWRLLPVVL